MEVTSENFEQALPLIEESIRNADFISFDAEFSGKFHKTMQLTYMDCLHILYQIYCQSNDAENGLS